MKEKWRDIDGYPGYQVSNTGRVRSYINNRHGIRKDLPPHFLSQHPNPRGYNTVQLGRRNRKLVSRLVAEAFMPNPKNLPMVRHMDDNPLNNNVKNLKWGTQVDNMQDCVRHGRLVGDTRAAIESRKIPIKAISLNGTYEKCFESMQSAARALNVWPQHISNVLHGKIKQTGGYRFEYLNEEVNYN